jgi:hypothetical protein
MPSLLVNFLATVPYISKLSSYKMAKSTLKALIAFDGIIMTDYFQDYMLAMKGRHTNAGTHSAQLSIIVRFNYKELQWDDTQEITSLPPPRLTQCPNYVRQRTDKALRSSTITNRTWISHAVQSTRLVEWGVCRP